MIWTSEDARDATGGKIFSSWSGGKIVFDSRMIEKGDIFIALPGQQADGHDFVEKAFAMGAEAAIVSKICTQNDKILLVEDTLKALNDLAQYKRRKTKAKIIAVTGSVGKTSIKEQLGLCFSALGETFISRGNYNNFLGVPINLASLADDAEFAIFEIGMDHAGEISPLTKLVKPDLTIITAIENIHRENFDSIEGIAKAKAEIFEGLKANGIAIINKTSNCYNLLHDICLKNNANTKIISFGQDSKLLNYAVNDNKTNAELEIDGKIFTIKFDYIIPYHQICNMAIALSAVNALSLDVEKSLQNLESFSLPRGRGMVSNIIVAGKHITLIDDSYNAGPVSVKAALKTMSNYTGRKIAILGDMAELGPESQQMHLDLKNDIIANKIDKVICYGKLMQDLYAALPNDKKLASVFNHKDLAQILLENLSDGDVILIKGSHYMTRLYYFTQSIYENKLDQI